MPPSAIAITRQGSKTIRELLCEGHEADGWPYAGPSEGQHKEDDVGSGSEEFKFPGFSFKDKNGNVTGEDVTDDHLATAEKILLEEFGAFHVYWAVPWVELYLDPTIPSAHKRLDSVTLPSSIGGCLPIWRSRLDCIDFARRSGHSGLARAVDDQVEDLELPSEVLATMQENQPFPDKTVLHLVENYFPDCEAITRYSAYLVLELVRRDVNSFADRLSELPQTIKGVNFEVRYSNGQLPKVQARKRQAKPDLKKATEDSTDYVAADGKFYPGSMIAQWMWTTWKTSPPQPMLVYLSKKTASDA
jgi:hypothetical protein